MKCASRRTSAGEKFSSSAHLGISMWIWLAKRVASPISSRCASCCGRSPMPAIMPRFAPSFAPLPHAPREHVQHLDRLLPAKARIGDALAEHERLAGLEVLATLHQVRLHHDADDVLLARRDL